MAPTLLSRTPSTQYIRQISRSLSSTLSQRSSSSDPSQTPPLASVFALIVRQGLGLSKRAISPILSRSSEHLSPSHRDILQSSSAAATAFLSSPPPSHLSKRQNVILAIPTTYEGLNAGPPPGTVVGVTIGAVAGFILILYIVLTLLRFTWIGGGTVVEEEIVRKHHHRSRSRSPRRQSATRVRETVVEERVERVSRERSRSRDEVIVEEEHDDIVEVIEEHSPERRPSRRESKRVSGYRTVDPAELGGGRAPMRKVSRR